MRLRRRRPQITNPDDFEIVKAWNRVMVEAGAKPRPKFDHSSCPPECPFKAPSD